MKVRSYLDLTGWLLGNKSATQSIQQSCLFCVSQSIRASAGIVRHVVLRSYAVNPKEWLYIRSHGDTDNWFKVCIPERPVGLFAGPVLVMVCIYIGSYCDVIVLKHVLKGDTSSLASVCGAVMLAWNTCGYFMRLPPSCREQTTNKKNECGKKTKLWLRLTCEHVQVIMKQTILIRNCIICVYPSYWEMG